MRCILAALVGLLFLVQGAGASETFVLPTTRCGDYFFVELAVSGDPERTLAMILDTGASQTNVDPDALERISGKPFKVGQHARFGELTAGGVTFSNIRAKAVELDHLERALGRPLDGILGQPAFEDVLLTYDYANSEVRVEFGELPPPDGREILRLVKETKRPVVRLHFGKSRRDVLIDTGAGSGFVLRHPDRLDWKMAPRPVSGAVRIDRIEIREGGRLAHDVAFGPAIVTTPTVEITDGTELVGADVLKHFTLTFDMRNRRMRLVPVTEGPIPSEPLRGMGVVLNPRTDGYRVERVFDDSPAFLAGVKPGDVITMVDGEAVYGRAICGEDDQVGDVRHLTIQRGAETLNMDVPIVAFVP